MAEIKPSPLVDQLYALGAEKCGSPACPARIWNGQGLAPAPDCPGWLWSSGFGLERSEWQNPSARLEQGWRRGLWVRQRIEPSADLEAERKRRGRPPLWRYHVSAVTPVELRALVQAAKTVAARAKNDHRRCGECGRLK